MFSSCFWGTVSPVFPLPRPHWECNLLQSLWTCLICLFSLRQMLSCLSAAYLVHFPTYLPANSLERIQIGWIKKREVKEETSQRLQEAAAAWDTLFTHAHTVISILTFVGGESIFSLQQASPSHRLLSPSLSLLLCSCCVCLCSLSEAAPHTGALMSRLRATQCRSPISWGVAATLTASEAVRHRTDLQSVGRQL